jgi:hypothetical protein
MVAAQLRKETDPRVLQAAIADAMQLGAQDFTVQQHLQAAVALRGSEWDAASVHGLFKGGTPEASRAEISSTHTIGDEAQDHVKRVAPTGSARKAQPAAIPTGPSKGTLGLS